MELFEDLVAALRSFEDGIEAKGLLRRTSGAGVEPWPAAPKGSIVLKEDTAVELGRPSDASVSFLVWTPEAHLVRDGEIALAGPDVHETTAAHLPFGKAVILAVSGMDETDCYEKHHELELLRFELSPKGYMIRAASQYMREWSRVSKEALAAGFSLRRLGASLTALYKRVPHVLAAEVLFVTYSSEAVQELGKIGKAAQERIQAMNRMVEEIAFDCDTCDYSAVCNEVDGLRAMHRRLAERR